MKVVVRSIIPQHLKFHINLFTLTSHHCSRILDVQYFPAQNGINAIAIPTVHNYSFIHSKNNSCKCAWFLYWHTMNFIPLIIIPETVWSSYLQIAWFSSIYWCERDKCGILVCVGPGKLFAMIHPLFYSFSPKFQPIILSNQLFPKRN